MKIITFIIFFLIMLLLGMLESFCLNNGSFFARDKEGFLKLRVKGGIVADDWPRILILAVVVGLIASLATVSGWLGLICYILALCVMFYITMWCYNEASQIRELVVFIIMLFVAYLVATKSYISLSGIIRNYAWFTVFKTVALVVLVGCITFILVSNLRYRSEGLHMVNPRKMSEAMQKIYPAMAVIVGIIGIALCVILFVTGIQWKGF